MICVLLLPSPKTTALPLGNKCALFAVFGYFMHINHQPTHSPVPLQAYVAYADDEHECEVKFATFLCDLNQLSLSLRRGCLLCTGRLVATGGAGTGAVAQASFIGM